jgi:hypothetical protein
VIDVTKINRPGRADLLRQIRDVVHDIPTFVTAPIFRRRHMNWGATPDEVAAALPGDDLLPRAAYSITRAIAIDAPPESVWPWLVQVGCQRAGFYSHDLLDNLGRPSATTVIAGLQQLRIGLLVPMSPSARHSDRTAFEVRSFETNASLLWAKADSTWAWQLTPVEGGTRLVTRLRGTYDWHRPLSAALGVALMEFGDFAMMRRMLLGIKARAESLAATASR